jgi:HEAT repeat protein
MTGPSEPVPPEGDEERRYRAVLRLEVRQPSAQQVLLAHLDDPSWRVRTAAADRLAQGEPAEIVPFLIAALVAAGTAGGRNGAAASLVQIGAPAVPALVAALAHQDRELRAAAVDTLGQLGDRRAVASLAGRLRDDDANLRAAAAEALGKLGGAEAVTALERAIASPDPTVRHAAAGALAHLRAPLPAGMLRELARDPTLRRAALRLAGASDDPAALRILTAGLAETSRTLRQAALAGLGHQRLRREAPPRVAAALPGAVAAAVAGLPTLSDAAAAALADEDVEVRAGAVAVLQGAGAGAVAHAGALAAAAEDELLRPLVAEALRALGPEAVDLLIGALPRLGPAPRLLALAALAAHGDARALPELLAALEVEDEAVRGPALSALAQLGDVRALPALSGLLGHADAAVSGAAVAALVEVASRGPAEQEAVLSAARARADVPRPATYRLLGRIGDEQDVPALRVGLRAPHRGTRVAAAGALAALGARVHLARSDAPELLDALDDVDGAVRAAAAHAVAALAGGPRGGGAAAGGWGEAIRALAMALGDEEPVVRAAAALALGHCGAVEFAPQLSLLAGDPSAPPEAAAAAVHALAELGQASADVLARAARHPDAEVAKEAVLAAAAVPGPAAAELLLAAAAHRRWDVRRAAAGALGARGERSLVDAVRRLAAAEEDPLVADALHATALLLEAR